MNRKNVIGRIGFAAASLLAGVAGAQTTMTVEMASPTMDRWMYPFNSQPGLETSVPVFAAISQAGFDDRDSGFLVGFDMSPEFPAGLPLDMYEVVSLRVTLTMSVGDRWSYDPTADVVQSSYATTDPEYVVDTDAGKPVEMFGVGYRNGQSSATFGESSAFSTFPPFPPREGVRSAFPAVFDSNGIATDVSRNVRQRFEAAAMALGLNPSLTPGALAPSGATLAFDVSTGDASAIAYVQRGLAEGRLRFMFTTLEAASGGPGGGTGDPTYPAFYTKENALGQAIGGLAKLEMVVRVNGCVVTCDVNRDGGADTSDVIDLANMIASGTETSGVCNDFNQDGGADTGDVLDLADAVAAGTCP